MYMYRLKHKYIRSNYMINCISMHSNQYRPGLLDMALPFSNSADSDIPTASSLRSTHLHIVLGSLHL